MKNKIKLQGADLSLLFDEYYQLRIEDLINQLSKGAYKHILKDKYGEYNVKMYYNNLWC